MRGHKLNILDAINLLLTEKYDIARIRSEKYEGIYLDKVTKRLMIIENKSLFKKRKTTRMFEASDIYHLKDEIFDIEVANNLKGYY